MLRLAERYIVSRLTASHLMASIVIAISSRIAVFFGSMFLPIRNEAGLPISPLTANTALDLAYTSRHKS